MIEESTTFKTGIDFAITGSVNSGSGTADRPSRSGGNKKPSSPGYALHFAHIFAKDGDITLPTGVNFVALRETFLSEAPFVKRGNRQFWKKWIDSRQFNNVFAGSLRMVTECILDNGTVDAKKLFVLPARLSLMAMSTRFDDDPVIAAATAAANANAASSSSPLSHSSYRPFSSNQGSQSLSHLMNTHGLGDADPYAFNTVSKHHIAANGHDLASYQSLLLEKISLNIAEMMMLDRDATSRTHDILFNRLPELLCFMIVNACIYALPRLTRLFNAIKFRELMIDWLNELIGGIRLTNSQLNREWLFKDAYDTNVLIMDPPNNLSTTNHEFSHLSPYKKSHQRKKTLPPLSPSSRQDSRINTVTISPELAAAEAEKERAMEQEEEERFLMWRKSSCSGAKSSFYLNTSPIISMYMNSNRGPHDKPFVSNHGCKLTMSHLPDRPVLSMQPKNVKQEGKFREKRMNSLALENILQHVAENRKEILAAKQRVYNSMLDDVRQINQDYKVQLDLLEKRPINQKLLFGGSNNKSASNSNYNSTTNSISGGGSVSDGSVSTTG